MNDSPLAKRIKSLLWRAAMMGIAVLVSYLMNNLTDLGLSPFMTGALGLVLGEVSKYLNTSGV